MGKGFHNKILRVDLSTREVTVEEPGDDFYRIYFGGWGFIAHYLLNELEPGADPLGPENPLIFAPGVVTGAPAGGSGRSAVGAKSPLTGGFGGAEVGGYWGAELKRAGWDAIVVTGEAEEPVYLWIKDDEVELRDAAHLWGQETLDVETAIQDELGETRARVAQIGPAGENLVRYACIIHDVNRAAGRTGLGAVMGSKRLKAVAVRGSQRLDVADQKSVIGIGKWLSENVPQTMQDYGTAASVTALDLMGGLPTRNFQEGTFEGAEAITGTTMAETILVKNDTCYACPVRCKRVVEAEGRYDVAPEYGGPEYETLGAIGSACGIDDLEAIAYANQLCNAYGLDTISTGMTIAWAMECFERGLLTGEETGGLDLHFGNAEAMVTLVEQIAHREGFGDLLAEGSARASRKMGEETEKYAMHVKGQEHPMHEPRIKFALGLGYATSPTGADHMHNIHDTFYAESPGHARAVGILEPLPADDLGPEKIRLAKYEIDWQVFQNCLGLCMFMPYSKPQVRDLINAVTGWDTTVFEMLKVGERAMAMTRVFNQREGFTPKDDVAHWRFATPMPAGAAEGVAVSPETMADALDLYYEMRGWDKQTGAPTDAKLYELGLGWLVD